MVLQPGVIRSVTTGVALAMAAYHLWVAFVGPPNALVLRSVHVGFALTLAFTVVVTPTVAGLFPAMGGQTGQTAVHDPHALQRAVQIVGEHLATFQEFPPRQRPGSFSIDKVMEMLMETNHN